MSVITNPYTKESDFKTVDFDPFAGPKLLKAIPTTEPQLEIWLSCVIGGDDANRSYNESVSLNLEGKLDRDKLVYSLNEVVKRHELLRATISPDGKSICIYEDLPLNLACLDLSDRSNTERETQLAKIHFEAANLVFDLEHGPLFQVKLIKLSETTHCLKLSAHHIICDGWSFGIILENLSKLYSSTKHDSLLQLSPSVSFGQYAGELAIYKRSNEYLDTERYWLNQYSDDIPVLDVPTDNPRPLTRSFASRRLDFPVSKSFIDEVRKIGAKSGASLVSTLIASFESLLHLLTGQANIVLGIPAAGQAATGHHELVGHCVNMLPLRSKITGEIPFAQHLRQRKSQILDDYDHQNFTFGSLLTKLSIARDSSRIPLIPIVLNLDMGMDANVSFAELEHSLSSDPRSFENFEIFLNITDTKEKIVFEWSYNTYLFKEESIERMMADYESLLQQIVTQPAIAIKDIILPSHNKNKPIEENLTQIEIWNTSTKTAYPKDKIVTEFILESAHRYPAKTAIYFHGAEMSYEELERKSNQFANLLIEKGVEKGAIVGLMVDRSFEMVVSLLAIIKSGAAYLPLDPQYPEGRLTYMLEDSGATHLIISEAHADFPAQCDAIVIEEALQGFKNHSSAKPNVDVSGDDLAYVLYTSGSTGKPKGVQIEHHSLTNFLLSFQKEPGISSDDKLLAITTISFDISATELYLPLIAGASFFIADAESAKDGRELLRIIKENKITVMQATPTTWQMMLGARWEDKLDLKALCGGESLSKDVAAKLLARTAELWNVYGPTETTIWSSIKRIDNNAELISIGRPVDNTQIYILDEHLQITPIGTLGEIYIAGDGLARSYLNRPELTSEKFVRNPFDKDVDSKMYATGDLGYYLNNGELICLGRKDAQVKVRGHRIELQEIEYNLIQQKGIKEVVVTAQGENAENQYLLAHIIPEENNQEEWHSLWNDIYREGIEKERDLSLEQQDLDIAIITNDEVDGVKHGTEWKNESVKRLKALNAKEILELGAGGGHLMFELAPNASKYVATDYSEVAINKLNEKLQLDAEKWRHVSAFAAPADDHSMVEGSFDLVLLHSVIQYFPGINYLFEVIEKSVRLLNEGGCLFIGDSQTAEAAYMHIAQEQLKYVGDKTTIKDFKNIIQYRIKQQNELSVDPDFFYFLPKLIPSIAAVDIQIRKGDYLNEGTKSHYDIWIYKGKSAPQVIESEVIEHWHEQLPSEWVENTLQDNQHKVIQIQGIHNQRVEKDFAIVQAIKTLNENTSTEDLRDFVKGNQRTQSLNPTDLWELGDRLGFHTHLRWANDGADGKIEAFFIPKEYKNRIPTQPSEIVLKSESDYLSIKKDQVALIELSDQQIQLWKKELKSMLPDYMVPVRYIGLDRFPTTSNGKIDRKNLPIPELKKSEVGFTPPSNQTEKEIAEIWSEFLSIKELSIHSNFFESGGHSLTAVRVMVAIEKKFGKKLAISTLFEHSTIEKLAKLITGEKKQSKWESLVPIKPTGSKTPVYLVHGGGFNVLTFEPFSKHMDPEQPIYALQGLGLNDTSKTFHSIEDIARFYISEIMDNDPIGPYALGGYCSGGLIAYEMARQLLERGKKVSLLAMLDSNYYDYESEEHPRIRNLKKAVSFFKSTLKYPRKSFQRIKARVYEYMPVQQNEISMYGAEVNANYNRAFENYKVKPLKIKIHLLKATERFSFIDDPQYYGWKEFALDGITVHTMPGNHNTFISSPNEKEFASTFQNVLNNTNGGGME